MKKITLIIMLFCVGFLNAQEENYTIKNIAANTKYQDYGVSYFGENAVIFASSRKEKSIRNKVWIGNKQPFLELYKGVLNEGGEITEVEHFSKKINSKFHDANIIFTKDLKTIYFTRNNYFDKKYKKDSTGWNLNQLYKAVTNEKGDWEIQQLPFSNDNYQTGHPALNKQENKLYFISDMPGTYGKTDIYVVDIFSDGTYSEPKNLGPNVNTKGKEMFPYVGENDLLYFSSDGFIDGNGGLDIYATRLDGDEPTLKAKNLGRPINSYKDDFGLMYLEGQNNGYFASNRPGGKGDDDIYYFEELKALDIDCYQYVEGIAKESGSNALIPNALIELFDGDGKPIGSVLSDKYGAFNFKVKCENPYKVVGSKDNYNNDSESFTASNVNDLEISMGLTLAPNEFITIRGLLMVNINPIYFDLDKSEIRPDAAIEVEKVVRIMKKYPEIKIELGSYTDSRAPDQYNLQLSKKRAQASIDWIIARGIDSSRITGEGFGETKLVNKCSNGIKCTESEHQLNRRTEFVIVNPEVIKEEN